MSNPISFGLVLRQERERRKLTQRGLGDLAGVSTGTVHHLESHPETWPKRGTLERLARALGIPLEKFLKKVAAASNDT